VTAAPESADTARQVFVESAQRAAGVVAARSRGDLTGAEALLNDFPSETAKSMGFFVLAELSLQTLATNTGQDLEEVARQLSLDIAVAFAQR
jgi:hypothetical protein